jgi:hypothetical protein
MKIRKVNELNEEKMNLSIAFDKFIKGQVAQGMVNYPPYGDGAGYYGNGIIFENGYKYISHGGGCSGEDCNSTFIVDPSDNLVANEEW